MSTPGPRLEKSAMRSSASVAPVVIRHQGRFPKHNRLMGHASITPKATSGDDSGDSGAVEVPDGLVQDLGFGS